MNAGLEVADIIVDEGDCGLRLDQALSRHLPDRSRTQLKRLIVSGCVEQDGAPFRDPSVKVRPGQRFLLTLPAVEDAAPRPQAIPLDIRFEDDDLIVIDKPAGLVVHPAPGNAEGTLVNALLAHCGAALIGIGGVRRPGIVHRLDKDTSGLIVIAKNDIAHRALTRDFAARRIDRAYTALVWGVPTPSSGEIAGNIGRSAVNRKKMAVVADHRGKPAITRYRVEQVFNNHAAQLECRLATGRTHQIRVHLAARGHPLIGDPVYGTRSGRNVATLGPAGATVAGFARQALHARLLGFDHPRGGRHLVFDSSPPADIEELLKNLELL